MESVTGQLAAFIVNARPEQAGAELADISAKVLADSLACIVAGAGSETAPGVLSYLDACGAVGDVPILGTTRTTSAEYAAFANGAFGHALEYDDVFSMMPGHPGVGLAAVAICECVRRPISGRELVDSYTVAYETAARMGIAMTLDHHRVRGFHATATLGVIANVALICRLRGLDVDTTRQAISIAASTASGLLAQIGTSVKPIHSGWAARNAVAATDLAVAGLKGSERVLEAPKGFFAAFGSDRSDPARIAENLGVRWALLTPGVTLKKYPCCFAVHRALDGLLDAVNDEDIRFEDVERIECRLPRKGLVNMIHPRPTTGLQAKFSTEYILLAALLDRRSTLTSFTDEAVMRDIIQQNLAMVKPIEDVACDGEGGEESGEVTGARGFIETTLLLKDGRRVSRRVADAPGSPKRPLSWEELAEKSRICAGYTGLDGGPMAEALLSLHNSDDMRSVITTLRGEGDRADVTRARRIEHG